jgi:hypothetical protein
MTSQNTDLSSWDTLYTVRLKLNKTTLVSVSVCMSTHWDQISSAEYGLVGCNAVQFGDKTDVSEEYIVSALCVEE